MQRLRNFIDRFLTYVGVLVVLGTMIFTDASRMQVSSVLFGLLILQLGVWQVASALLPSARKNHLLREEINQFIKLIREGHRAATAKETSALETIADKLRARTEGVIDAARTDLA